VVFFLPDFASEHARHVKLLFDLIQQGKLKPFVDEGDFTGLDRIPEAIDYLYKGRNKGKVVVKLNPPALPKDIDLMGLELTL